MPLPDSNATRHYFDIEYEKRSDTSILFFTRHRFTKQRRVIKILRPYKDTRYSFETLDKRQRCQFEAIYKNRIFAPEIYIGLAPVYEQSLNQICTGEIIKDPVKDDIKIGREYALLMEQLPENYSLVNILSFIDIFERERLMKFLIRYIANIHITSGILGRPSSEKNNLSWGSIEQLKLKLDHNLELFDLMLKIEENKYKVYLPLKNMLMNVLMKNQHHGYFKQRQQGLYIKHCHGDLKASNIWISFRNERKGEKKFERVIVLDAIDFNPSYNNIDILSDFALFVVDIQARTDSFFAERIIKEYLEITDQRSEACQFVLDYYLVEKAIVGAAVSIVYDHLIDIGHSYLAVAQMRAKKLIQRMNLLK